LGVPQHRFRRRELKLVEGGAEHDAWKRRENEKDSRFTIFYQNTFERERKPFFLFFIFAVSIIFKIWDGTLIKIIEYILCVFIDLKEIHVTYE
jgi:hypothetical protein